MRSSVRLLCSRHKWQKDGDDHRSERGSAKVRSQKRSAHPCTCTGDLGSPQGALQLPTSKFHPPLLMSIDVRFGRAIAGITSRAPPTRAASSCGSCMPMSRRAKAHGRTGRWLRRRTCAGTNDDLRCAADRGVWTMTLPVIIFRMHVPRSRRVFLACSSYKQARDFRFVLFSPAPFKTTPNSLSHLLFTTRHEPSINEYKQLHTKASALANTRNSYNDHTKHINNSKPPQTWAPSSLASSPWSMPSQAASWPS